MSELFRLPAAVDRDPAIAAWMRARPGALGAIAQQWFAVMRGCGTDVREVLHDGHPTVCVGDAAFAYVNAFTAHVNVGFFRGAELPDPAKLLEGTGRYMRHVKLHPDRPVETAALRALIEQAHADMRGRVRAASSARREAGSTLSRGAV
jgi:hypothetical protein